MSLRKIVSLNQAILYGIGIIVGAGIYTLIGLGAGIAGYALWLSFIVAGIIASLTAFSYCELSSRFTREGAEAFFATKAFNKKSLSFIVGLLALLSGIFSAATVAWGFASYFKLFFNIEPVIVVVTLLFLLSLINLRGMQQSLLYENIMTAMTLLGLFIIILFGFGQINLPLIIGNTPAENSFSLVNSVFAAAALVFFAYLGFENIANISEETIDSKKNTPKAITFALAFVTVLYVLIALISTSVVAPEQLAIAADPNQPLTEGPLALVAEKVVMPGFGFWLSVFALFATASTIIALLNVSSRILYGLSSQGLFPKVFRELDQKGVPINAILFILFATIVLGLIGNLSLLGNLTTANTFLLFFAVNSSLIVLKLNERKPEKKHKFEFVEEKVLQFEAMPITAILGAGFCLLMFLTQFWQPVDFFGIKMPLILFNLGILLLALLVYKMKRD